MPIDLNKEDALQGKTDKRSIKRITQNLTIGGNRKNAGRKVGSYNSKNMERLNKIDEVLDILDEYIVDDLLALPPKIRAAYWKDLVEYRRPKLARTESEVEVKKSTIKVLDSVEDDEIKATFSLKGVKDVVDKDDEDFDEFLNDL
jgi:hypothetical protein